MNKTLYVGNLKYECTNDELKKLFESHGEIVKAVVIPRKGFGFVEFLDEATAQKAMDALNNSEFMGRKLFINFARPPKEDKS